MRAILRTLRDWVNRTPTTFIGWLAVSALAFGHWAFGYQNLQDLYAMCAIWFLDMVTQAVETIGDDLRLIAIAVDRNAASHPKRERINLRIAWFLFLVVIVLVQSFFRKSATTDDLLGLLFTWLFVAGRSTIEYIREQLKTVRSSVETTWVGKPIQ